MDVAMSCDIGGKRVYIWCVNGMVMQGLSAARSRYESKVLQAGLGIDSEIRMQMVQERTLQ